MVALKIFQLDYSLEKNLKMTKCLEISQRVVTPRKKNRIVTCQNNNNNNNYNNNNNNNGSSTLSFVIHRTGKTVPLPQYGSFICFRSISWIFPHYGIGQTIEIEFSNLFLQYFQNILFSYYERSPICPLTQEPSHSQFFIMNNIQV